MLHIRHSIVLEEQGCQNAGGRGRSAGDLLHPYSIRIGSIESVFMDSTSLTTASVADQFLGNSENPLLFVSTLTRRNTAALQTP